MKQKTIIQVWGVANTGKSATIKISKEELIKKYINPSHTYPLPIERGDINEILSCKGIKIGIESMGDDLWYDNLHDRLNQFVHNDKCDIIICASRVRNNVANHIEYLANNNGYRKIKITSTNGTEPPLVQADLNQFSAQQIVELVNKIISGII